MGSIKIYVYYVCVYVYTVYIYTIHIYIHVCIHTYTSVVYDRYNRVTNGFGMLFKCGTWYRIRHSQSMVSLQWDATRDDLTKQPTTCWAAQSPNWLRVPKSIKGSNSWMPCIRYAPVPDQEIEKQRALLLRRIDAEHASGKCNLHYLVSFAFHPSTVSEKVCWKFDFAVCKESWRYSQSPPQNSIWPAHGTAETASWRGSFNTHVTDPHKSCKATGPSAPSTVKAPHDALVKVIKPYTIRYNLI